MTDRRLDNLQALQRPTGPEDFDALYTGRPPWDIGRPQPAFAKLVSEGRLRGKVLDVGCGTGEHALMAAAAGLEAIGIDGAPTAVAGAERKAADRGLRARFITWNALDLARLGEQFDTVLDCGLFHVFTDEDRPRFVESLRSVMPAGGTYHMLCFSERQPGDFGPRRVTQAEIRAAFADGWHVESIDPARIATTAQPDGAFAWHAVITKR